MGAIGAEEPVQENGTEELKEVDRMTKVGGQGCRNHVQIVAEAEVELRGQTVVEAADCILALVGDVNFRNWVEMALVLAVVEAVGRLRSPVPEGHHHQGRKRHIRCYLELLQAAG